MITRPTPDQLREFMALAGLKTRRELAKLAMVSDSTVDTWLADGDAKQQCLMPENKWELVKARTDHPDRLPVFKQQA